MMLNLKIYDAKNMPRGSTRMKLDWPQRRWAVVEDDVRQAWQRVGFSQQGHFEYKSWGVIWLWDMHRNTVIIRDAPMGEALVSKSDEGYARIYDPRDPAFKDGKIDWSIEPEQPPKAAPLSALRQELLKKLPEILPAQYKGSPAESKNYTANPFHVRSEDVANGYTTCGEFPAYVVHLLGGKMRPGTTGLQPQAEKRSAWRTPDGKTRPRPGDFYALCDSVRVDHSVAHIGVIVDPTGNSVWKTADWGQGTGFRGDFVDRAYDSAAGTLAGEVDRKKGNIRPHRAIKGWLDLDAYFAKP